MNNEMTIRAILLANDKALNKKKTDKILEKEINLVDECRTLEYQKGGKPKQLVVTSKLFVTMLKGIIVEINEQKQRAKTISKLFKIETQNVTGDINKLIQSEGNYIAYASDLDYSATESKNQLKNLKLIWGNANLRALHDFNKIKSLEIVIGDMYLSTGENIESLNNLKVITGDLHAENLENTDFLKGLQYVGGHIYMKNSIKSLEEIKSIIPVKSKQK